MEQVKAKRTYRCLFPEAVEREDRLTVLRAVLRFLRVHGYWGKSPEVARLMGCEKGALADLVVVLIDSGHLERTSTRNGRSTYMLTSRGFDLLGIEPITPTRRRPTKRRLERMINATAQRIEKANMERAQQAAIA